MSLRRKLVCVMLGVMSVAIVLTALVSSRTLSISLTKQLDEQLSLARPVLSVGISNAYANVLDDSTDTSGDRAFDPAMGISNAYVDIRDQSGQILYTMPRSSVAPFSGDSPLLDPEHRAQLASHPGAPGTVPGSHVNSSDWRAMLVPLPSSELDVYIALPLDQVDSTVRQTSVLVLASGTLMTLVMAMVAYGLTGRSLRPLLKVERTASMIADGDYSKRVADYPAETEVGSLSRSLNAMLAQIEKAFRDREASETKMRRFIQDASHELRTPLVTIQGYSEFYRYGGLESKDALDSAMGRIEAESKRMSSLVDDLLMLARLDEQRPLEKQPVDLLVMGLDAVEDAKVRAAQRKVSLVGLAEGTGPVSAPALGDDARLRQVIANLVTNALRYTPEGTDLEIAVGVRSLVAGGKDSVIEIRDHGPGIPPEDAKRIFERFYRADSSRQRETGGSGLGLAIVAAIVQQHGGAVWLSDTPGGGATMSISLPYVAPQDPEDHDLNEQG